MSLPIMCVALCTVGLLACGSSEDDGLAGPVPGADARSTPDTPDGPAKLTLGVNAAERIQRIAFSPAPADPNVFVAVELTLINSGEARPLPVDLSKFWLATAESILYGAHALSARLDRPCPLSAAVASGGVLSCELLFEVPRAEGVSDLVYDDEDGRSISAQIPTVAPPEVLCSGWPTNQTCDACLRDPARVRRCADRNELVAAECANERASGCFIDALCPQLTAPCANSALKACREAIDQYQGCTYDVCQPVPTVTAPRHALRTRTRAAWSLRAR